MSAGNGARDAAAEARVDSGDPLEPCFRDNARVSGAHTCRRNIEMTPLCKVEVTLPRVLGSREVRDLMTGLIDMRGSTATTYPVMASVSPMKNMAFSNGANPDSVNTLGFSVTVK